jgi:hypothetical protein
MLSFDFDIRDSFLFRRVWTFPLNTFVLFFWGVMED